MFNDFVLVGPAADPAGLEEADSASEALTRISLSGKFFASRGMIRVRTRKVGVMALSGDRSIGGQWGLVLVRPAPVWALR